MKKISAIFFLFFTIHISAQNVKTFEHGNTKIDIYANGTLRNLIIPKDSNKIALRQLNLWLGAKQNNQIYVAANSQIPGNDFFPGVLDTINGSADDSAKWNKIFTITKTEIENHIANFNKPNYSIPDAIKNWPGSGGGSFPKVLASFIDFNQNGTYEPLLGDVPFIKGDIASCVIYNDNYASHTSSNGNALKAQVLLTLDYYKNQSENVIYATYLIHNRSLVDYDSAYAGLWSDMIIGKEGDEYVSSDSNRNAMIVFNGNDIDSFSDGYGHNPPALGVVFLNRKLNQTIAISDDNSVIGNALTPREYFNYLGGNWKDGSHLTTGFNGYQSGIETNYIFNGNACNSVGWTELGSVLTPGKRRMLGSVFQDKLDRNKFIKLEIALVWNRGNSANESLCGLAEKIDSAKAFYKQNITASYIPKKRVEFNIFPNPVETVFYIESISDHKAEVYDINGKYIQKMDIKAGKNELDFNGYKSGIYIINIEGLRTKIIKK